MTLLTFWNYSPRQGESIAIFFMLIRCALMELQGYQVWRTYRVGGATIGAGSTYCFGPHDSVNVQHSKVEETLDNKSGNMVVLMEVLSNILSRWR